MQKKNLSLEIWPELWQVPKTASAKVLAKSLAKGYLARTLASQGMGYGHPGRAEGPPNLLGIRNKIFLSYSENAPGLGGIIF